MRFLPTSVNKLNHPFDPHSFPGAMTYSQTWGTPQERHPIRRFLAELEMAGCVNLGVAFVKRVALGNATRLKSYSSAQRIYTLRELACSVGPVGTTGSVAVPVCHTLPQALAWANTPKTFPMWRSEHARASSFPMQEMNCIDCHCVC